jgi:hypothetical protein
MLADCTVRVMSSPADGNLIYHFAEKLVIMEYRGRGSNGS